MMLAHTPVSAFGGYVASLSTLTQLDSGRDVRDGPTFGSAQLSSAQPIMPLPHCDVPTDAHQPMLLTSV